MFVRIRRVRPPPDQKAEYASFLTPRQQSVSGLATEGLKIADGRAIGCQYAQARVRRHSAQHAIRPQDRQRTVHALHVEQSLTHEGKMRRVVQLGKPVFRTARSISLHAT